MSSPSTSVHQMIHTLRARQARVPSEVGAYLVLETCEKLRNRPSIVSAEHVEVGGSGEVAVSTTAPADEQQAAASLCRLLSFMLVASEDNISPGLLEILEVDPAAWTLDRLRDALEANLVPLNRQASRRVLSRLVRESQRPGPTTAPDASLSLASAQLPALDDADASLDAFLSSELESSEFVSSELVSGDCEAGAEAAPDDLDLDLELPDLDLPGLDSPAAVDFPRPEPRSIFSQRESDFERLGDADDARSMWPWIAVAALVAIGVVALSTLV